jgi:hypothetical protein
VAILLTPNIFQYSQMILELNNKSTAMIPVYFPLAFLPNWLTFDQDDYRLEQIAFISSNAATFSH